MSKFLKKLSWLTRHAMFVFSILLFLCCSHNEVLKPPPPTNLVATTISTSQIDLSWTDNSADETGFKIERKTGAEPYSVVSVVDKDVSTYTDNDLSDNTTYTYKVLAYNSAGNSPAYSNEAVGTTLKILSLASLTTQSVSSVTHYSAICGGSISFDGNSSITAKGVVWSTEPNPTISLATKTNEGIGSTDFVSSITNLKWITQYYVRSYATNSSGTAYGNEITFTTKSIYLTFIIEAADITFYWKDTNGQILRSLGNLKTFVEASGKTLRFAMNGGMYLPDNSPQGLYIENEIENAKLDTASGYGNFYLKPNGVFYITTDNKAVVRETSSFSNTGNIKFATQSGPMLLIDGNIHPVFKINSSSLNIRNGVGILPDGRVLFVMSKTSVNLYAFATFFKSLGCVNALYLDGAISLTYLPEEGWEELGGNFGVMIGVNQ